MIQPRTYKTIYADPPWPESGGGRIKRGADRWYPLMSLDAIAALTVEDLPVRNLLHPEGAHLYLWTTNNYLEASFSVLKAWGFEYITTVTWAKIGRLGLGQYFRGATEHCLFATTKKKLPYRTLPDGKRAQGLTLITAERQDHSRKPQEMRRYIEAVSHPPYLELFARDRFEGWDVWGNEVG